MPSYNTKFELSVEDMDLIESALLKSRKEVECNEKVGALHDLLGRLHNQKVFLPSPARLSWRLSR